MSKVVSITTFVSVAPLASSRRVASMPSSSGMRTSISTTSGCEAPRLRDRLEPVGGLADDLDVLLGLEDHAEARPHERLVVDDQDAQAHSAVTGSRARSS